jgi:hypothetical protein
MSERNRTLGHILRQYEKFVKPCYEEFCLPTKKYADVIIPRGADNHGWCLEILFNKIKLIHYFDVSNEFFRKQIFHIIQFHNFAVAIDVIVNHIQEFLLTPHVSPTMNEQRKNCSS